jgi:hypothetical protein
MISSLLAMREGESLDKLKLGFLDFLIPLHILFGVISFTSLFHYSAGVELDGTPCEQKQKEMIFK